MQEIGLLMHGLGNAFTPSYFLLILLGTALGITFGAIPGISTNMGVTLCLPITFGMEPFHAMALLLAVYIGGTSGGLISAILLNIPGTPAAMTTALDGNPMALKGEAGKAIGVGILTSFVGGMISFAVLIFLAPLVAKVALKFGPFEYCAIGLLSLTLISSMVSGSVVKGLLACLVGASLAMTGPAPIDAFVRYGFGIPELSNGIGSLPVMIGMFAIPELLKLAENRKDTSMDRIASYEIHGFGISMKEYLSHSVCVLRSAFLGTGIGILPGLGGSTAGMISYMTAKKQSKHPEEYGKGSVEGLISSETANNACIGGAIVPMLALGIPGDTITSVLMGALTLHGINPGPLMFIEEIELVYQIFAILIVANFIMLAMERLGLPVFVRLLTISKRLILPVVLLMCFTGAFSYKRNVADVLVVVISGIVGYFLQKSGFPRAPIILGFVLTPIVEKNLRQGLMVSKMSYLPFVQRPIALVCLILTVVSLVLGVRKNMKEAKEAKQAKA